MTKSSYVVSHGIDSRDAAFFQTLQAASAPFKGMLNGPEGRAGYDEMMAAVPAAPLVAYTPDTVGGVQGVWCRPADLDKPAAAILYLHGGGYAVGSAWAYRHLVGQLAYRAQVVAFVPDYPLAPEHPFPAGLQQAQAAFAGLAQHGIHKAVIAGDSAGGGLTLALLQSLVQGKGTAGQAVTPRGAIAMSPWTDMTLGGASHSSRSEQEFYLTRDALQTFANHYLQGQDPRNPQASPLFGDLRNLPPILMHTGDAEILLDDTLNYAAAAHAAGVCVSAHIWAGMPHVFPSAVGTVAAEMALASMAAFAVQQLA